MNTFDSLGWMSYLKVYSMLTVDTKVPARKLSPADARMKVVYCFHDPGVASTSWQDRLVIILAYYTEKADSKIIDYRNK